LALQTIVIIMSLSFVAFVTILHVIGKVRSWFGRQKAAAPAWGTSAA